jgi:hypothetical protein
VASISRATNSACTCASNTFPKSSDCSMLSPPQEAIPSRFFSSRIDIFQDSRRITA